jgi:enamine deaminase RidA (YjgF/YER057c/UK114 family)
MSATVRYSNPKGLAPMPGYNHVAEVTGPCRVIYVAGQLGYGPDGKRKGEPGDFSAQCVQAFENLKIALADAGAGFEHVVKVNTYIVDIAKHVNAYRKIRDRYMDPAAMPPSTAVGVAALAREPEALFEIEIVAVMPLNPSKT